MKRKQSILAVLLAIILLVSVVSFAGCAKKNDEDTAVDLIQKAYSSENIKILSGKLVYKSEEVTLYCKLQKGTADPDCYNITKSLIWRDAGKTTARMYPNKQKAPAECNSTTDLDYNYINTKLKLASLSVATIVILAVLAIIVVVGVVLLIKNREKIKKWNDARKEKRRQKEEEEARKLDEYRRQYREKLREEMKNKPQPQNQPDKQSEPEKKETPGIVYGLRVWSAIEIISGIICFFAYLETLKTLAVVLLLAGLLSGMLFIAFAKVIDLLNDIKENTKPKK